MSTLSHLQSVVTSVLQPGPRQGDAILKLGEFLIENKLRGFLSQFAAGKQEQSREDLKEVIKELVSIPDRTINVIGTSPDEFPDWIYPAGYCDQILRNLSLALRDLKDHQDVDMEFFILLVQQLFTLMPDFVMSCDTWWRFIVTTPAVTRGLLSRVVSGARVKAVATVLRYTCNPDTLSCLFGNSITESETLSLLTIRMKSWCEADHVWCLVSILGRSDPDTLAKLAENTVKVWGDEVVVDQGDITYLRVISWTLCSCLGVMSGVARDRLRDRVMRGVMTGVPHWLEADRTKRQHGLSVAVAVLGRLDSPAPEWRIEDTETLEVMRSLTREDRKVEEIRYEVDLENWGREKAVSTDNETMKQCNEKKSRQAALDSDDSDASDDDDLPAYDMSDDMPYDKDKKPLLYVRDVLDAFADQDSNQQEDGLERIPELAKSRLKYEDAEVVTELLSSTLHLQNKFDSQDWVILRQSALTSVVTCQPAASALFLPSRVFDKEVTLDTKFLILDSLVEGAAELRDSRSPHVDKFLSLCITSLCDGGGGSWGRVKVAGLETSLLTQTLLGVASLAKLGVHTPSFPRQLTTLTELLVSVSASQTKRPVQAACLHGLGTVAGLVEPHMLDWEGLGELLARGARWAGALGGDLGEGGRATCEMLSYRHQEMVRARVERELSVDTEIKMSVSKPEMSVKCSNVLM